MSGVRSQDLPQTIAIEQYDPLPRPAESIPQQGGDGRLASPGKTCDPVDASGRPLDMNRRHALPVESAPRFPLEKWLQYSRTRVSGAKLLGRAHVEHCKRGGFHAIEIHERRISSDSHNQIIAACVQLF